VKVGHGSVVGGAPQDLKHKDGTPSGVRVGADTVLREYVTVHRSTRAEGWTDIGRDCLVMGLSHVAHDCRLGDGVIVINYAGITGHCEIGDRATVGGLSGMVPFTRIGPCAYVGGMAKLTADVPPFVLVEGQPATARAINVIGLRRAGMAAGDRRALQDAFRILYRSGHMGQYHVLVYAELPDVELVGVADADSKRAAAVAEQYDTRVFADHRALVGRVDVASVAVPTEQHFAVARDLLEGGVSVLVEK